MVVGVEDVVALAVEEEEEDGVVGMVVAEVVAEVVAGTCVLNAVFPIISFQRFTP